MYLHQRKSSANAETGICMLTANQVCVSKKHNSTDAVAICMLLHQCIIPANKLCVEGSIPSPDTRDSSAGRATTLEAQVRFLLPPLAG